jgi:hypothetical protein
MSCFWESIATSTNFVLDKMIRNGIMRIRIWRSGQRAVESRALSRLWRMNGRPTLRRERSVLIPLSARHRVIRAG